MATKLTNPFCISYVHIHSEAEARALEKFCQDNALEVEHDIGDTPRHKWMCEACGNEVREHGGDGGCPV